MKENSEGGNFLDCFSQRALFLYDLFLKGILWALLIAGRDIVTEDKPIQFEVLIYLLLKLYFCICILVVSRFKSH